MTFQLGAETMSNPYEDLTVQVALTELRDVTFTSADTFACGDKFILGQGYPLFASCMAPLRTPQRPEEYSPAKSSATKKSCAHMTQSTIIQQELSEIASAGLHEEHSSTLPDKPSQHTNKPSSVE